jgi:hypothetical protein
MMRSIEPSMTRAIKATFLRLEARRIDIPSRVISPFTSANAPAKSRSVSRTLLLSSLQKVSLLLLLIHRTGLGQRGSAGDMAQSSPATGADRIQRSGFAHVAKDRRVVLVIAPARVESAAWRE